MGRFPHVVGLCCHRRLPSTELSIAMTTGSGQGKVANLRQDIRRRTPDRRSREAGHSLLHGSALRQPAHLSAGALTLCRSRPPTAWSEQPAPAERTGGPERR